MIYNLFQNSRKYRIALSCINKLKKLSLVNPIAVALLLMTYQNAARGSAQVFVNCGDNTVLAGFRFTKSNDCHTMTISNSAKIERSLGISGTVLFKNDTFVYDNYTNYGSRDNRINSANFTIIMLPKKSSLTLIVNYDMSVEAAQVMSRLVQTVYINCDDGPQAKAGVLFTPTCSDQIASFTVTNNTSSKKIVGFSGSRNNFGIRIYKTVQSQGQVNFDLSAISTMKNVSTHNFQVEIRN